MKPLTLGELISLLEKEDPAQVLPVGFENAHSYRGYYERVAFAPAVRISVASMLEDARGAADRLFVGYHGGEYYMNEDSLVHFAVYGISYEGSEFSMQLYNSLFGRGCRREYFEKEPIQRERICGAPVHPGLQWCLACVSLVSNQTHEADRKRRESGDCWCYDCARDAMDKATEDGMNPMEAMMKFQRFHVCPVCENKRCPLATDHFNSCGHSNRLGQEGSRFGNVPMTEEEENGSI